MLAKAKFVLYIEDGDYLSTDFKYAYSVGRIRVIENKLFSKNEIERMIDSKTPEEALRVITDAGYGYSPSDVTDPYDYEILLKEEYEKTYNLLMEIAPEPKVFDVFLRKNDYHNLKVILKAEFLGVGKQDFVLKTSFIPVGKLEEMVKDRQLIDMPVIMKEAVEECIDTFNRTKDPQLIDLILDRALFTQMKEGADKLNNHFISELVLIMIDLTNIYMFIRAKKIGKTLDFLNRILLNGGSIDKNIFFEHFNSSEEEFINALKYTRYAQICEEGILDYKKTGNFIKLEKLFDNYIILFIKKTKYITLGVQPLVGFLLAKENEIKAIRIIMVGKINNISNDVIRERLRDTYV